MKVERLKAFYIPNWTAADFLQLEPRALQAHFTKDYPSESPIHFPVSEQVNTTAEIQSPESQPYSLNPKPQIPDPKPWVKKN